MAIAVRSTSASTGGSKFASSTSCAVPTGASAGDVVLVFLSHGYNTNAITPPTGFTAIGTGVTQGSMHLHAYWKRLTGSDTGSYTFSWTGSAWTECAAICFTGVIASGDPVEGAWSATGTSWPTITGVTTTSAGCGFGHYICTDDGGVTFTAPTSQGGWTLFYPGDGDGASYNVVSTALSNASISGGTDSSSADQVARAVALKPAATGTNYTQNPSDSAGLSDSVEILASGSVARTDNTGLSDSVSFAGSYVRDFSDSAGLSDKLSNASFPCPVGVSADGRYLVDQQGNPWFFRGDTVWDFPVNAGANAGDVGTPVDVFNYYCETRASQGYNGLLFSVIGATDNGGPFVDGSTWDGIAPFVGGVVGQMNETYWQRIDALMDALLANGMVAFMDVIDGYTNNDAFASATAQQCQDYGVALGNRYKDYPNLVWVIGSDFFGIYNTSDTALASNTMTGIRSTGDTHLLTVDQFAETTSRYTSEGDPYQWGIDNTQFNFVYTYQAFYVMMERAYAETPTLPVIWGDGHYYQNAMGAAQITLCRNLWAWALTSGSTGVNYGSQDTHFWHAEAYASLTSTNDDFGNTHLPLLIDTFLSFGNWWELVPDVNSQLVTSGRGTHLGIIASGGGNGEYAGGNNYVTASKTADGTLAVIYFPTTGTITVNTAALDASATQARWVDPANGAETAATFGTSYTTPGANSFGANDWFLVLSAPPSTDWTKDFSDSTGLTDGTPTVGDEELVTNTVDLTDSVTVDVAAGGSNFTEDQPDSAGVTDSVALDVSLGRSDAANLTDSVTVAIGHVIDTSSTVAVTDSDALAANYVLDVIDSLDLTDTTARNLGRSLDVADNAGLTDAATTAANHVIAVSDSTTVADAITLNTSLGMPSETDAAQPLAKQKSKAVGQPFDGETAQPITVAKSKAVSVVVESDAAQTATAQKSRTLGEAVETDAPQPATHSKTVGIGLASETDDAFLVSSGGMGTAVESDSALSITASKRKAVGQVVETDAAQPAIVGHGVHVGQAVETGTAQATGRTKQVAVGQAVETDSALAVFGGRLKQATETDSALAVTVVKRRSVGQASESETAQAAGSAKYATVVQVVESGTAQQIRPMKSVTLAGPAVEDDTAASIILPQRVAVGQAVEAGTALSILGKRSSDADVDVTIVVGATRGGSLAVGSSRNGSVSASATRPSGTEVEAEPTRSSTDVGDTRSSWSLGNTRRDRNR